MHDATRHDVSSHGVTITTTAPATTAPAQSGTTGAVDVAALQAEVAQLRTALHRRPVIDMAKGAVMAFTRCDEDAAFRTLSDASQTHNVKLFDLAAALLADLPRDAAAPDTLAARLAARLWTGGRTSTP